MGPLTGDTDAAVFLVAEDDDTERVDVEAGAAFGAGTPLSELVFVAQAADGSSATVRHGDRTLELPVGKVVVLD